MQILCGALRAVTVETLGVVLVLWVLQGATGLAVNPPWRETKSPVIASKVQQAWSSMTARSDRSETDARDQLDVREQAVDAEIGRHPQSGSVRQWFGRILPSRVAQQGGPARIEQPPFQVADSDLRAEYARERLDHFSQLYGIASRN